VKFNFKEATGKVARYLKETRTELKKVLWPSRQETIVLTTVVVVSVAIVALVVWVMDSAFSAMLGLLIR